MVDRIRQLLSVKPGLTAEQIAGILAYPEQDVERTLRTTLRGEVFNINSRFSLKPATEHRGTPSQLASGEHDITSQPAFERGQEVRLRADLNQKGAVIDVDANAGSYRVFFSQHHISWYNEEELIPVEEPVGRHIVGRDEFIRNLALVKIRGRFSDILYSYLASRTIVQPHQFRPVAKFLESADARLLIADEVGLGKTIEAGIIYLEMKARTNLEKFLVVCPSRLRDKWESEFRDRFGETLKKMDKRDFQDFLDKIERGEQPRLRAVVAIESIRDKMISSRIASLGVRFDLIVVDEAHHMRNRGTLTNELGHVLSDAADAMLLLTATPINLGNEDLFHLLNILSEGEFPDMGTFEGLREPSEVINQAIRLLGPDPDQQGECLEQLMRLTESSIGQQIAEYHPDYEHVKARLEAGFQLSLEDIAELKNKLAAVSPLSRVLNRTRKRDVPDSGAMREAYTQPCNLTQDEMDFYNEYINYVKLDYMLRNQEMPIGFVLVMKERQAASCLVAVRNSLRTESSNSLIGYEGLDSELDFESDELDESIARTMTRSRIRGETNPELQAERDASLDRLQEIGKSIGDADSKFDSFLRILREVHANEPEAKILVFSSFKPTLRHIEHQLRAEKAWITGGVRLLTGDVPMDDRTALIEQFKTAKGFSVLLLSEVGSEGLDFQFTDILINYDLPWNPMRVEQRIGRIDRFGQQSDKVRIYSLLLNNTIETRVLGRLYERIGVFRESIGELEPILGEIVKHLTQNMFAPNLSETQKTERAERELNAIEAKRIAYRNLSELEDRLMGQDILLSRETDERVNRGLFFSEEELRTLLVTGLEERYGRAHLTTTEDGYFLLRPNARLPEDIITYCRNVNRPPSRLEVRMRNDLESGELSLTFKGNLAHNHPTVHLLNSDHPLIQFAAAAFPNTESADLGVLHLPDSNWERGRYPFFIYRVDIQAIDSRTELVAVVMDEDWNLRDDLAAGLLGRITGAADWTAEPPVNIITDWDDYLLKANNELVDKRRVMHETTKRRNDTLLNGRRIAIWDTYDVKLNRIQEKLDQATNANIRRMHEGEIRNRTADRDYKLQELEMKREVSVGSDLLLQGVIMVGDPGEADDMQSVDSPPVIEEFQLVPNRSTLEPGMDDPEAMKQVLEDEDVKLHLRAQDRRAT